MAANSEWYYAKGEQQFGPVSSAELKELAATGALIATDLVWKEGLSDWKEAASVKGLFSLTTTGTPAPPPIPNKASTSAKHGEQSEQSSSKNVSEAVKSDFTDLMSSAKKAKDLTVAQARKTQIRQMTLPNAYFSLGKDIFSNDRFREEFSDLFAQIEARNDEIAKVKSNAKELPPATDLKGKVKSGAAQLMAQGQATKLGLQRDSLIRELGKRAFESHGDSAGPSDLVKAITSAQEELIRLDEQIQALPRSSAIPIWQRVPLAALLTVCCFPLGLALVWLNPRLTKRSKITWAGGVLGFFAIMMIFSAILTSQANQELAAAHALWDAGDHPAAISKYRTLAKENLSFLAESDRSLILGRVIDFDAEAGNDTAAEELLKKADDFHVMPTITSARARTLLEKRKQELKRIAEEKKLSEAAAAATKRDSTNPSEPKQENSGGLVTADILHSAYRSNSVGAGKKYTGKKLTVFGKVHSVQNMSFVGVTIFISGEQHPGILLGCVLDGKSGRSKELESLNSGDYVRITGVCEGADIVGTVSFKNCSFSTAASRSH